MCVSVTIERQRFYFAIISSSAYNTSIIVSVAKEASVIRIKSNNVWSVQSVPLASPRCSKPFHEANSNWWDKIRLLSALEATLQYIFAFHGANVINRTWRFVLRSTCDEKGSNPDGISIDLRKITKPSGITTFQRDCVGCRRHKLTECRW